MPKQYIKDSAIQLQNAMTNSKLKKDSKGDIIEEKKADISGTMLCEELEAFKSIFPDEFQDPVNPEKLSKYFIKSKRHASFPNIFFAVKIFLTILVSLASREKSFPKLKLIKTFLRSTMKQKWFSAAVPKLFFFTAPFEDLKILAAP